MIDELKLTEKFSAKNFLCSCAKSTKFVELYKLKLFKKFYIRNEDSSAAFELFSSMHLNDSQTWTSLMNFASTFISTT